MPRYFALISREELKAKVDALPYSHYQWHEVFGSDLKVSFDCEDFDTLGYHTLDNGLTYLLCSAGGDWELPVHFIVYWDGKKLRAYVPTDGNPWNTTTKQAYGNDEEADGKNAKKRWPALFDGSPVDADQLWGNKLEDRNLMLEDIQKRILPKS